MTLEYLEAEERVRPRWQRPVIIGGVLVAVVAVALTWASGQVRVQANRELVRAMTEVDHDARAGEDVVLSMLEYTSPTIWSTRVGEDVRAGMRGLVEGSARQVVGNLQETRDAVAATLVLPWDGTQRRAKDAVLALVSAHLERFERIAGDASAIGPVFAAEEPSDDTARALLRASGATADDGH